MAKKSKTGKVSATSKKSAPLKADVPRSAFERIVPIPSIDVYSELPFALVERNGERISPSTSDTNTSKRKLAKPASSTTQKATAAAKRPAKKASKKASASTRTQH